MTKLDLIQIAKLLKTHGIALDHWEEPRQGMINQTIIINQKYVLRADINDPDSLFSRYQGEVRAYARLREVGLPVPEIIALDLTRTIVPLPYMLMTRVPGQPMAYAWKDMSSSDRTAAATEAGKMLAQMHDAPMEAFGWLSNLDTQPMSSAVELFESLFASTLRTALQFNAFDAQVQTRIVALWERVKPLVARVREPHLIHRDYNFENILVDEGHITGIIDFEWGASGDPAWDFMVAHRWDEQCPGSAALMYQGYQSVRPLPDRLDILERFYLLSLHLDMIGIMRGTPYQDTEYSRMMVLLEALEKEKF